MPIEFRCTRCGKLLRTGDGTAGRQAQCPVCGTIGTVPGGTPTPETTTPSLAASQDAVAPMGGSADDAAGQPPLGNQSAFQPLGYEVAPPQPQPGVAERVLGPAMAMLVIGWVTFVLSLLAMIYWIVVVAALSSNIPLEGVPANGPERGQAMMAGVAMIVVCVIWAALSILILIGGQRMRRLQSYGLAMTAAIVAVIPCIAPCCLLTLPFGIWALIALNDPSVKAAFRH
ncbi:MAG: hypothetical protein ABFC96_06365 [Thermoguttaceae bacterium]